MVAQEEIVLIKGKRSNRPRPPSPLALTMPASSSTTASGGTGGGSGELTRGRDEEEKDMANCLMLLAKGQTQKRPPPAVVAAANVAAEFNYQCKTCNKSFSSFRALGGHRASHSKSPIIKPIIGNNNKQEFFLSSSHGESTILSLQTLGQDKITVRVHECSICGAGFASGQALGGHMRRHRPLPAVINHGESPVQAKRLRTVLSLDLNLPAPEDINHDHQRENKFTLAVPQQQVIVFSAAPSLVDCQY